MSRLQIWDLDHTTQHTRYGSIPLAVVDTIANWDSPLRCERLKTLKENFHDVKPEGHFSDTVYLFCRQTDLKSKHIFGDLVDSWRQWLSVRVPQVNRAGL